MKRLYLVMGPSGCGKSTLGKELSHEMKLPFLEADDFHNKANREKMAEGTPLRDEDRWGWLEAICLRVNRSDKDIVLACSALKRKYRRFLADRCDRQLKVLYLQVSEEELRDRVEQREAHFFPADLVKSQLADLEEPSLEEFDEDQLLVINGSSSIQRSLATAKAYLQGP